MSDWNVWRKEVDRFDIDYELSRFDEIKTKTYREAIKDLKSALNISQLMYPSAYSIKRRILTPKENARQRAQFDGITTAYKESIKLFQDADRFAWEPQETLEKLAKIIRMRSKEMEIARKQYDAKNKKKIYNEMFVTVEIRFLISTWRLYLKQNDEFKKS